MHYHFFFFSSLNIASTVAKKNFFSIASKPALQFFFSFGILWSGTKEGTLKYKRKKTQNIWFTFLYKNFLLLIIKERESKKKKKEEKRKEEKRVVKSGKKKAVRVILRLFSLSLSTDSFFVQF